MSTGSILGGGIGGVIGAFFGPVGVVVGLGLGFILGAVLDPMTPDMPGAGTPNPDNKIMGAKIGTPIPDLCGTAKVTGQLLFFGNERSVAITQKVKSGLFSSKRVTIGHNYYMSWGLGLVACPADPVDTLYAIYKNDDKEPVWPIFATELEEKNWEGLTLPAEGGSATIQIKNIGLCTFFFGTNDQMPVVEESTRTITIPLLGSEFTIPWNTPPVSEIISDETLNTPYRRLCWAFMDECNIGKQNRTPTYRFLLKKIPKIAAMPDNAEIQGYDCNPAHAIYYIFNVLSGLPLSWLDDNSFNALAVTLAEENRGICLLLENQQSVLNYITNINAHIDGIIRYGADGKLHAKLIRDDYIDDDLLLVDDTVMLEDPKFNRGSWIDTINEVKIQYNELPRYINMRTGVTYSVSIVTSVPGTLINT